MREYPLQQGFTFLCRLDKTHVTLFGQKMTMASSAGKWFSWSFKNPPQCLLRSYKTSSTSSVQSYSTLVHKHANVVSFPSSSRQPRSFKSSGASCGSTVSSVLHEPFAKARRKFSASAMSLHNALIPPKPGEEYVVKYFP